MLSIFAPSLSCFGRQDDDARKPIDIAVSTAIKNNAPSKRYHQIFCRLS